MVADIPIHFSSPYSQKTTQSWRFHFSEPLPWMLVTHYCDDMDKMQQMGVRDSMDTSHEGRTSKQYQPANLTPTWSHLNKLKEEADIKTKHNW